MAQAFEDAKTMLGDFYAYVASIIVQDSITPLMEVVSTVIDKLPTETVDLQSQVVLFEPPIDNAPYDNRQRSRSVSPIPERPEERKAKKCRGSYRSEVPLFGPQNNNK